jgi:hypothetical protein
VRQAVISLFQFSWSQFQFVMWINGGERAWDVKEGWAKPTHSDVEYGPSVCRTCYWALFTPTGPAAAASFLGGIGRIGPFHSKSGTFRSNVQGEHFSSHGIYVQVECPCVFLFIAYVFDERYWMRPNQGYQKFWLILFSQKISYIYTWINTLRKP